MVKNTPSRAKSAIPKGHPVNVYTDPKFKLNKQSSLMPRASNKNSVTKISDLRNPFKKWKPSQRNKHTARNLKQIDRIEAEQK
jgi:hypothetical protein